MYYTERKRIKHWMEVVNLYFNKKRWKLYLRYRTTRMFMICEDMHLLNWFYYLTHTEEEIWAEEEKALQELRAFIERHKRQEEPQVLEV